MLGSRRMQRFASGLSVVGMLVAGSACEPPPPPSDNIEVTYVTIPGVSDPSIRPWTLNNRGQLLATELLPTGDAFEIFVNAYLWDGGQATRIGEEGKLVSPEDLSNHSHVVGSTGESFGQPGRPFLWKDGELTLLPSPEGTSPNTQSDVYVNDRGTVAGTLPGPRPTVWHKGDIVTAPVVGIATGINNRNQVLIQTADEEGTRHALWEVGGETILLGEDIVDTLTDLRFGGRNALNGRGMVLGRGTTEQGHGGATEPGHRRALLWHEGQTTDLGTLGGDEARATAVNEWGQVVGVSTDEDGNEHPFIWYQGEMTRLTMPEGSEVTGFEPTAINNWGQVIGLGDGSDGVRQPFLWQNGRIVNLGELIEGAESWPSGTPMGMNDRGQIAGAAVDPDGEAIYVMWEVSPTWGYWPDGLTP